MDKLGSTGSNSKELKLLVLDSSYSLEAIKERGLLDSVTCRDLDGFFDHVWTVHPFASLVNSERWGKKFGSPETYSINKRHSFIEGKVGLLKALKRFGPINFIFSQIDIIIRLTKLIKKENINVIRAGDVLYLGLLGWILSRLTGVPYIVRVGGNNDKVYETTGKPLMPRLFISRKVEKRIERFVLSNADLVAGANQDNLNFALANGAKPDKSTLFRYGNLIDRAHFIPPKERDKGVKQLQGLGLQPKQFILYIGRLEAVKHPDHIIKILAQLRNKGFNLKAALVGDGRLLGALKELAINEHVADSVVFSGNLDQKSLSEIIPNAAVVISPHTGRALSEAALGEVPIVAYDIDWQAEVIKTGITGELVKHGDIQGMVCSTIKYLTDQKYALEMAAAVRIHMLEMMCPEKLDQHERSTYRTLLNLN